LEEMVKDLTRRLQLQNELHKNFKKALLLKLRTDLSDSESEDEAEMSE
jgi:hypothetical protein